MERDEGAEVLVLVLNNGKRKEEDAFCLGQVVSFCFWLHVDEMWVQCQCRGEEKGDGRREEVS